MLCIADGEALAFTGPRSLVVGIPNLFQLSQCNAAMLWFADFRVQIVKKGPASQNKVHLCTFLSTNYNLCLLNKVNVDFLIIIFSQFSGSIPSVYRCCCCCCCCWGFGSQRIVCFLHKYETNYEMLHLGNHYLECSRKLTHGLKSV